MAEVNFSTASELFEEIDARIGSEEFGSLSTQGKLGELRQMSHIVGSQVIGLQPNTASLGTLDGPMDAFQHAFSAGVMTGEYGAIPTYIGGALNELQYSIRDGNWTAARMDDYNNRVGIFAAYTTEGSQALAEALYSAGLLGGLLRIGLDTDRWGDSLTHEELVNWSSNISDQECFLASTPIQMWPTDPLIKPRSDGNYDEAFILSKVWEKPIDEITAGDLVVSYDAQGRIAPGPVTRIMRNTVTYILDFWGTGTTPGHAYYCSDGVFEDQHVPIMDILRTDGAIMRADGIKVRAATNCEIGSMGDRMIHASATVQRIDGSWTALQQSKVRFGTRIILPDGRHMSFLEMAQQEGWKVSDDGYMVASTTGADGVASERKFFFPYGYGEALPKPEDYILARSDVSLEDIYAAGEWEQIGTQMPAPDSMSGLNDNHSLTASRIAKPKPNIPPAFADRPDVPQNAAETSAKLNSVH